MQSPNPRYHFLYLPTTLGADWLFVAGRRYWETFRPLTISTLDLLAYVPPNEAAVVTLMLRRDFAAEVLTEVQTRFPRLTLDPLVYDLPEELQLTLDARAARNQRFGL